jgi:integrase
MPAESPAVALMAAFPDSFPAYGGKRLRKRVQVDIQKLDLVWNGDDRQLHIPDNIWNEWQDALGRDEAGDRLAYETRQCYQRLLLHLAQHWQAAGLIQELPSLKSSPHHHRHLSVRVEKLHSRFSEYTDLVSHFVDQLSGSASTLVPESLQGELEPVLGLALVLSGIVTERPGMVLSALHWSDVTLHPQMPLRLPRAERRGYVWLGIPPLTRLLLFAQCYRTQKNGDKTVFPNNGDLTRQVRTLLDEICDSAGLSHISLPDLSAQLQLHLRQSLPNPHLAVLSGLLPHRSVPADQAAAWLGITGIVSHTDKELIDRDIDPEENAEFHTSSGNDDDVLLSRYDQLLETLRPYLAEIFTGALSPEKKKTLAVWLEKEPKPGDIAHHNLHWLVRWLQSLGKDRKLKAGSIETYTYAVLRVLRELPHLRLEEIDTASLAAALEGEYAASTRRVTKAAWRHLRSYLEKEGLDCVPLAFEQVRVTADHRAVRILFGKMPKQLARSLFGDPAIWAVYLAWSARLRVSEVCRLMAGDLVLGQQPYLLVRRSKRGRSRRVRLEHLREDALQLLRKLQASGLSISPEAPLLVDREGKVLEPAAVSARVGQVMKDLGLRADDLPGTAVRFHSLRAAGARQDFTQSGDVRYAARQLGHSLALTTVGSYLSHLDLEAVQLLKGWVTPLNRPQLHLPVKTLAVLMGKSDRRVEQWLDDFNQAFPDEAIQRRLPDELPDGVRPGRSGRSAHYLSVQDAIRLVLWRIQES